MTLLELALLALKKRDENYKPPQKTTMNEKTMTEVLIEIMNDEKRPIPIREFVEGLRKAGFIESYEMLDEKGIEYKIKFAAKL